MNTNTNTEDIEAKKDLFDLRRELNFVARHHDIYARNTRQLTIGHSFIEPFWEYRNEGCLAPAVIVQLQPHEINLLVSAIPETFRTLSQLRVVDYGHAGKVPVPIFLDNGDWNKGASLVPVENFPREGDHSGRILVGYSTGHFIYPTAIPVSVHCDATYRWFYQAHVFLHEFFHSIELPLRDNAKRKSVRLKPQNGDGYSFEQWWNFWVEEYANPHRFPSMYSELYQDSLSWKTMQDCPAEFERALAEVVCESFVGYMLGIVPNADDEPDFEKRNSWEWSMINKLANSAVVSS